MKDYITPGDIIKAFGVVIAGIVFYFSTIKDLEGRVTRLEANEETLLRYVQEMRMDIKELVNRR